MWMDKMLENVCRDHPVEHVVAKGKSRGVLLLYVQLSAIVGTIAEVNLFEEWRIEIRQPIMIECVANESQVYSSSRTYL
jgi:hypothetical protein